MKPHYDIAVIGSGFAGSLFAMIAHRLGRSVVLVDKGKHPRVVIGESSTPLTNLLLEELTIRYDLPALRPLTKWGTWQKSYPEIACGLKRGFTFYHHDLDRPTTSSPGRTQQLLVAASPNDEIADTHWYRADFDHLFVRQAVSMGIDYFDETEITSFHQSGSGMRLEGKRKDYDVDLAARFVVDASGPRGFLHRTLGLEDLPLPDFPATQALYSHFSGVGRLESTPFGRNDETPPYPIDDAAVHHVFDGGWIWVLHFNNGMTSAGVAATDHVAEGIRFADGEEAWRRALRKIPALEKQFENAKAERPFTHIPRLSFRSAKMTGANWALLPSAGGFVDPLLSTGFPLALLGIARLAELIEHEWESEGFAPGLAKYSAQTEAELLAAARLIASLYANMNNFPVFSALSLIYFAAASFSETARRLGKPQLASSFLLQDDPDFAAVFANLLARARNVHAGDESPVLIQDIVESIEPWNVAGLGKPERRNWYPADAQDLFDSAQKVAASRQDISELLLRCGFPE